MTDLHVAIAHEWLIKHAGSERCVVEMRREFPGARLMTTIVGDESSLPIELRGAEPSLLQCVPGAAGAYQWLIPVMPVAWASRRAIDDVDIVISSSHACAKGVRVADGIPHLCYCHTPMRYAWDFASESARFPTALRPVARATAAGLRRWDRGTARSVTRFIANSTAVAARIKASYGREAIVVPPPVDTDFFTPAGDRGDYFLYVGRFVAYKRPDLVVEAFRGLPHRLVMVGDGHMEPQLRQASSSNVSFERDVSPERLRDLYRGARALVYPGEEDFGIVMAEALACGTPVIALGAGGAVDIVEDGVTGVLLGEPTVRQVREAVTRVANHGVAAGPGAISSAAERFGAPVFRAALRGHVEEVASRSGDRAAVSTATGRSAT